MDISFIHETAQAPFWLRCSGIFIGFILPAIAGVWGYLKCRSELHLPTFFVFLFLSMVLSAGLAGLSLITIFTVFPKGVCWIGFLGAWIAILLGAPDFLALNVRDYLAPLAGLAFFWFLPLISGGLFVKAMEKRLSRWTTAWLYPLSLFLATNLYVFGCYSVLEGKRGYLSVADYKNFQETLRQKMQSFDLASERVEIEYDRLRGAAQVSLRLKPQEEALIEGGQSVTDFDYDPPLGKSVYGIARLPDSGHVLWRDLENISSPAKENLSADLADGLKSKDLDVRVAAYNKAGKLGRLADPAIPILADILQKKSDEPPLLSLDGQLALHALDDMGTPDSIKVLNEHWDLRIATVCSKEVQNKTQLLLLLDMEHIRPEIYGKGTRCLLQQGPGTAHLLIHHLNGKAKNLRASHRVIELLREIGTAGIPALRHGLKFKNHWLARSASAESLGKMGPKAVPAIPDLVQAIETIDSASWIFDVSTRESVSKSRKMKLMEQLKARLGSRAEGVDIQQAIEEFKNGDHYTVLSAAIEALGQMGPPAESAIPCLKTVIDRYGTMVYGQEAFESLGKIGRASVKTLLEFTRSARDETCFRAIETLGDMGPKAQEAVSELAKALEKETLPFTGSSIINAEGHYRTKLASALKKIGTPEALKAAGGYKSEDEIAEDMLQQDSKPKNLREFVERILK